MCVVQNSTETLQQLEAAFDEVKEKLFTELHQVVREQIFPPVPKETLQLPENSSDSESHSDGASQSGALAALVEDGATAANRSSL